MSDAKLWAQYVALEKERDALRAELAVLKSALHYPECWDTAAYPTIESALHEVAAFYRCTECRPPTPPSVPKKLTVSQAPTSQYAAGWNDCIKMIAAAPTPGEG